MLVAVLNAITVSAALAQSTQATKFADPAVASTLPASGISSMGQVTVALVIVLAVLFAAAWAMRQFKMFNRPGQGTLQVLQGVSVGPKERAVLIKINDRRLLLGVASGSVNLLLELPAEADAESGSAVPAPTNFPPNPEAPNFKALLKRSMGLS